MSDRTAASVTPIEQARQSRRLRAAALNRVLDASLDLARAERAGHALDEAELMILDCCDEIGGVRGIVAAEAGDPYLRDPQAPSDPKDPRYDF